MQNNKNKKTLLAVKVIILLLIIIGCAAAFYFFKDKKDDLSYKTARIMRTDIISTIQSTGTLNPVETVDVGTQISGTIKELYFDYNSKVYKGQLIALMDSATQQADVSQAEASLLSAQADMLNSEAALDVAFKDLKRTKELAKRDLIAKADVDRDTAVYLKAKATLAASRARVSQTKAALSKSRINLGYTKIYSPVDGTIIAKNVEEGQTVAASYQTPSIAEIARDLTQMQVEVKVDEADIGGVHEGQEAEFTVDTFPNDKFEGKVTQVRLSPSTSNNVVTYTVIVKVSNQSGKLLPGMTANVSLILEKREKVIAAPNSAFRFRPQQTSDANKKTGYFGPGSRKANIAEFIKPAVYTLDKNNNPVKVEVEKGITNGQVTEIISGIDEGATVITGINVKKEGK